jgi:hypothetical protein
LEIPSAKKLLSALCQRAAYATNRRAAPALQWCFVVSQFEPVGTSIAAILFLASLALCCADPAPVIHYAPIENLEHVDVALIDRAEHEIDMAGYVLV